MSTEINKSLSFYKEFAFLEDYELDIIKEAGKQLAEREEKDAVTDGFISMLKKNANRHNYSDDVIAGAKANDIVFWTDLVVDPLGDGFMGRHRQFATVFSSMGVTYEGYWAAVSYYYKIVIDYFEKYDLLSVELVYAYKKMESAHMSIISEVYRELNEARLQEQNEALQEMSTPVTQLWEGILLLPLVGYIDSKRAQNVTQTMLNMIGKTQSKVFILDISGIAVVDTAVANYLIKITKATRLMGCNCLLSGISSSVAQTIVELGIQIDEMETTGNMREALNQALGKTGAKVVYLED